jgi:glycosyltransferase involved in cell wall biosynthesis
MEKQEDFSWIAYAACLIPALNEEEGIAHTITELRTQFSGLKILVVDGNSSDNTVRVAKDLGVDVISQEGEGKGDALDFGLKYIDSKAQYVIIDDADFTYPVEFIPEMIKILQDDPTVGMVCGNRFNSTYPIKDMKKVFYIGNKIIASVHTLLNNIDLKDPLTGLRVVRVDLMRNWTPKSKSFDIEVELNSYVEKKGYRIVEVPISYRARIGEKKLRVKHGWAILSRIISETL